MSGEDEAKAALRARVKEMKDGIAAMLEPHALPGSGGVITLALGPISRIEAPSSRSLRRVRFTWLLRAWAFRRCAQVIFLAALALPLAIFGSTHGCSDEQPVEDFCAFMANTGNCYADQARYCDHWREPLFRSPVWNVQAKKRTDSIEPAL